MLAERGVSVDHFTICRWVQWYAPEMQEALILPMALPRAGSWQAKCLKNAVEANHGKLKQLIPPVRGSKTLPTAYATINGFEVM